jgi:hypothetical protein
VAAPSLDRVVAISPTGNVTRLDRWTSVEAVNFIPFPKCGFLDKDWTYFTSIFSPAQPPAGIHRFSVAAFQNLGTNLVAKAIVTSGATAGMGVLAPNNNTTRITQFDNIGSSHEGSAFVDCSAPRFVAIRTDPGGNTPKSINPRSSGTIFFAILSSLTFDATQVVVGANIPSYGPSPTYGFTGVENSVIFDSCENRDVDNDGRLDKRCKATIQALGIVPPDQVYSGPLIAKFLYIGPGGDPEGEGSD